MRYVTQFAALFAVLVMTTACDPGASVAEEKTSIINLLHAQYGNDGGDILIEPIIVRSKYAIADWTQSNGGGRALVHKEGGGWKVVVAAGAEMRDPQFLEQAGVPQAEAKALANVLMTAERSIPEERLAKFDSYGGADVRAAVTN